MKKWPTFVSRQSTIRLQQTHDEIWGTFEINNTIAYALRHILLKASEMEQ